MTSAEQLAGTWKMLSWRRESVATKWGSLPDRELRLVCQCAHYVRGQFAIPQAISQTL